MTKKPKYPIQRKYSRVNVNILVKMEHHSRLQEFYSSNISGGGVYLQVDEFIPVGETVKLNFKIPELDEDLFVEAEVVRHHTSQGMDDDLNPREIKGIGLAFTSLSEEQALMIQKHIAGKGLSIEG